MSASIAFHGLVQFQGVKSIAAYATPGLKSAVHLAVHQTDGSDDIMIFLSDSILAARLIDAINTVVGERATELLEASVLESHLSYYVVLLRYADGSDEAIVNPAHDWQDIVDRVADACSENQPVTRVDHVSGSRAFDCTEKACWAVCHRLASECEPLTDAQWEWIETHCGPKAAAAFGRIAA